MMDSRRRPRLGIVLPDRNGLRAARSQDPVDVVLLRQTLTEPLRGAAARRLREQLGEIHPGAESIPYVWHLVSHGMHEGLRSLGGRTLSGEPSRFGELQETDEVARAWTAVQSCATGLGARRVVLQTPASIAPGSLGRQRLTRFIEARRAEGTQVVWEPQGLWTREQAVRFARELQVPVLLPAFEQGRFKEITGTWVLLEAQALGRGAAGHLETIADVLLETGDIDVVLLGGPEPYRHLRTLAALLGPDG